MDDVNTLMHDAQPRTGLPALERDRKIQAWRLLRTEQPEYGAADGQVPVPLLLLIPVDVKKILENGRENFQDPLQLIFADSRPKFF